MLYVDMEERQLWVRAGGGPVKLAFEGLPEVVYPAVSIRAPGQVRMKFRTGACCGSEV